jgi:DNA-directed RNA polymerase specialized sigma24 family protein
VLKLATILDEIRTKHRGATIEDIRNAFGDYNNVLRWLAAFLTGDDSLAQDCVVDACTIAESQTSDFHEWLVHGGARATVRCTLQREHIKIAELAPKYEIGEPAPEHPPLPVKQFLWLINNAAEIHARLDVLCRSVLVLRGIAKDSYDEVATQLGISRSAVEQAYSVAFDALTMVAKLDLCSCGPADI